MESHKFLATWGEFIPTLEDVASLTMLPLFGEMNAIGIVLKEGDQTKLKHLTIAMATLKTSAKAPY